MPELFEPPDFGLRELLERELCECGAPPERERSLEELAALLGAGAARIVELHLEAACVHVVRLHAEDVSRRSCLQDVGPELLPQARDGVLERGRRGLRRSLAPEQID